MTDARADGQPAPEAPLPAEAVIARFGGIRPMAAKLGIAVTTVQGWKGRGTIPPGRRAEVEAAARTHGIDLSDLPAPEASSTPEEIGGSLPDEQTGETEPRRDSAEPTPGSLGQPAPAETAAPTGDIQRGETTKGDRPAAATPDAAAEAEAPRAEKSPSEGPLPAAGPPPPVRETVIRRGGGAAWLAVALALLALAAVVTQPYWQPLVAEATGGRLGSVAVEHPAPQYPAPPEPDAAAMEAAASRAAAPLQSRLDGLGGTVAEIERRLSAMETAAPAAGAEDTAALARSLEAVQTETADLLPAVEQLREGIAGLERRLTDLETQARGPAPETRAEIAELRAAMGGLQAEVALLAGQVGDRGRQLAEEGRRAAAIGLAAMQFDSAVRSGEPYARAFDLLRTLAADETALLEALAPLAGSAHRGIPSRTALVQRFHAIAPQIVAARSDGEWTDRMLANLQSVVRVRRVDGEGEAQSPVSRAETALEANDLAGAASALEGLGPPAAAWVADAKARLAADEALDAVGRYAAQLLGAARDRTPGPAPAAGQGGGGAG